MKHYLLALCLWALPFSVGRSQNPANVYFTSEITAESLLRIYHSLGMEATGRVAVKISTGESSRTYYLRPELIGSLVREVGGNIVECNTAYTGNRSNTESHRRAIAERGFNDIATVDIMDEDGSLDIPVADNTHIQFDRVGSHIANYDFLINIAHFKGHAMGGFGGSMKNIAIGCADGRIGKAQVHAIDDVSKPWDQWPAKERLMETMAESAKAVIDYFGKHIVYINVMKNMSVDCDCCAVAEDPKLGDIGILSSLDPVALDQACLDLVYASDDPGKGDLIKRIESRNGVHTIEAAAALGVGSREYELITL